MNVKNDFVDCLHQAIGEHMDKSAIEGMIEAPKFEEMGDLAFPCFGLAKALRQSPQRIAEEIVSQLDASLFKKAEAVSGYVNVFLDQQNVSAFVLKKILSEKHHYGDSQLGSNQVITIDFSSPNIAKPFSMGHIRSTVIGNALAHIAEKCGYKTIRINHLGDWGTQFGKLIVAYKKWGNEQAVRNEPLKELLELYVQFHEEAEKAPSLMDEARVWFKKLEEADEEALQLWKWFREESLKEFSKMYALMGVEFDSYDGEAFFNDKMERVVQILREKNLLEESDGAQVVMLEDLPPCLIKKRDGTTLYATRDLAAAIYRQETYHFAKSLYVVGNEQALHFKQLLKVLEKMGYKWQEGIKHVPFGMILKDGRKMSTRKGRIVLLEDVLNDAYTLALKEIQKKNPHLASKETVARQVGTGAVIFHDLKNYRLNDIHFSLEDMLRFEGETGPYVQYTYARAASLLRKGGFTVNQEAIHMEDLEAWPITKMLAAFPEVPIRAMEDCDPSLVAKYVIELARAFNKYYASVRILDDDQQKQARLSLVFAVTVVLKEGLRLLGLEAPEEM
ncbi:arginine--tRNA ligase [Gracilibacillus sp. Marseille-QA3620]